MRNPFESIEAKVRRSLTAHWTPQTHGRVECFHGRIAEVLATYRFNAPRTWEPRGWAMSELCIYPLPQNALSHAHPIEAVKK